MIAILRKYSAVFRVGLSSGLEYRLNFFSNTVLGVIMGATVNIFVWRSVYESSGGLQIGSLTVAQMMGYLLCASIFSNLSGGHSAPERQASDDIRSGDLNKYITKPISHSVYMLASAFAYRLSVFFVILLPFLLLSIPILRSFGAELSAVGFLCGVAILLIGVLFNFYIGLTLSYLAFWMDEVWTFHVVKDISMWFLGGMMLPMSALPEPARTIADWLPFQTIAYLPSAFSIGVISPDLLPTYLLRGIFWVAVAIGMNQLVWRRGMARYGAFGG